ncbi:MAG: ROK family protein [Christensenellaceae bacterium]|nr:ROK family protein [Christensenellaceae bacterium]MEA5066641.1 ROK family protein [Eubacteriales bacterium]MEA5068450.1 ROK family protein [Christensenellaceae bacterium]
MVTLGIDLGGTGIKAGVVDEDGHLIVKDRCPTRPERGHEAVIWDMAALSRRVVEAAGLKMGDISGVGVGIPGVEDAARGIVPFCTNLGWHEVPLTAMLGGLLGLPVKVGNDATVAALAEAVAGVSRMTRSSVLVTLGTGVGGGVILDGRPFVGAHGVATEIGHLIVKFDGVMCTCGNRGCWERYASASALIREGRAAAEANPAGGIALACGGQPDMISAKLVIDVARGGDPDAMRIFEDYVFWVTVGLANLINIYDPEVIALGGGVSAAGTFLLDAVRKKLPELVFFKAMPYARVELAVLGNDAGIIGAAMLSRIHANPAAAGFA